MAVTGCKSLLRCVRGCYGVYVPLFSRESGLAWLLRDRFTWRCDRAITSRAYFNGLVLTPRRPQQVSRVWEKAGIQHKWAIRRDSWIIGNCRRIWHGNYWPGHRGANTNCSDRTCQHISMLISIPLWLWLPEYIRFLYKFIMPPIRILIECFHSTIVLFRPIMNLLVPAIPPAPWADQVNLTVFGHVYFSAAALLKYKAWIMRMPITKGGI